MRLRLGVVSFASGWSPEAFLLDLHVHPKRIPIRQDSVDDASTFRRETLRVVASTAFGLEMARPSPDGKGTPHHINPRSHPRSSIVRNRTSEGFHREPRRLTEKDASEHLSGERAMFAVARPDRRCVEYAIDLDGEGEQIGFSYEMAAAWARQCFEKVFPDIEVFIEPGRSFPQKIGIYVRFRVDWGTISDPQVRHQLEQALNQLLRGAFVDAPAGIKYDALKGTTRFRYPNPHYDSVLANTLTDKPARRSLVKLSYAQAELLWRPRDSGVSLADEWAIKPAMTSDYGTDVVHIFEDDAKRIREKMPQWFFPPATKEWVTLTERELYEREKLFYGISGKSQDYNARFTHNPALEPEHEHFGSLVTHACFACKRGDRPDNLQAWYDWIARGTGVVKCRVLKKVLGSKAWKSLMSSPPTCSPDVREPNEKPQAGKGLDWMLLTDPDVERLHSYNAGARIALRETKTDEDTVKRVLTLWERDDGPCDGPRHQEREERAERFVAYWSALYDEKAVGQDEVWFSDDDVMDLSKDLAKVVSEQELEQARFEQGRTPSGRLRSAKLTHVLLSRISCWLLKGVVTGNIGEVPTVAIRRGLEHQGLKVSGSTVSAAVGLLVKKRLVSATTWAKDRCRCFRIVATVMIRQWMGAVPEQVMVVQQHKPEVVLLNNTRRYAEGMAGLLPPLLKNRVALPIEHVVLKIAAQWQVDASSCLGRFSGGKGKAHQKVA